MNTYLRAIPLALLALLMLATPASAGRTWCRADPTFTLNGRLVHVYVSSYAEMYTTATGPVQVVLTVPRGATAQLIQSDRGFGYGYTIRIEYSDKLQVTAKTIHIQTAVYAPATDGSLPVKVDIEWVKTSQATGSLASGNGSTTTTTSKPGFANTWVVAKTPTN